LGGFAYALGYNYGGGIRYQSNVVPICLLGGVGVLLLSGALVLARSPEMLSRSATAAGIVVLSLMAWLCVALYARYVSQLIAVRADIVMGSESQFVDHIIRLRAGQPQYTPMEDANSSAYTPGAMLLTYAIARLIGYPTSIPVFRLVQQLYLSVAVGFAVVAARALLRLCRPDTRQGNLWLLFWVPFLYLIANNPYTNVFTHVLYSDALALGVNAVAFWLLIKHFATADDRWLLPMALWPAVAFWAKQKEAIWAVLYVVYLVLAGRVAWRRILLFGVASFALLGLSVGVGYALWGGPFFFWTFKVLSSIHVSLNKILEQVTSSGSSASLPPSPTMATT
jgi:hypothetical protein